MYGARPSDRVRHLGHGLATSSWLALEKHPNTGTKFYVIYFVPTRGRSLHAYGRSMYMYIPAMPIDLPTIFHFALLIIVNSISLVEPCPLFLRGRARGSAI